MKHKKLLRSILSAALVLSLTALPALATDQKLLYQEAVELNKKNYKEPAWEKAPEQETKAPEQETTVPGYTQLVGVDIDLDSIIYYPNNPTLASYYANNQKENILKSFETVRSRSVILVPPAAFIYDSWSPYTFKPSSIDYTALQLYRTWLFDPASHVNDPYWVQPPEWATVLFYTDDNVGPIWGYAPGALTVWMYTDHGWRLFKPYYREILYKHRNELATFNPLINNWNSAPLFPLGEFRAGSSDDLEPLLTRGDVANLLHLAAGSPQLSDDENWGYPYPDVPGDSELAMPIYWARLQGLLFGYGDGSFGVDDPVTREQLFTIVYRFLNNGQSGFVNDEWDYTIPYSDVDEMADFAGEAVSWLELNGVSLGFSDGTLGPKETVTLTDFQDFLSRLLPSGESPASVESPAP